MTQLVSQEESVVEQQQQLLPLHSTSNPIGSYHDFRNAQYLKSNIMYSGLSWKPLRHNNATLSVKFDPIEISTGKQSSADESANKLWWIEDNLRNTNVYKYYLTK